MRSSDESTPLHEVVTNVIEEEMRLSEIKVMLDFRDWTKSAEFTVFRRSHPNLVAWLTAKLHEPIRQRTLLTTLGNIVCRTRAIQRPADRLRLMAKFLTAYQQVNGLRFGYTDTAMQQYQAALAELEQEFAHLVTPAA